MRLLRHICGHGEYKLMRFARNQQYGFFSAAIIPRSTLEKEALFRHLAHYAVSFFRRLLIAGGIW
jgi:hypothetical protein